MTPEQVRRILERRPFLSLTLRMRDGSSYDVEQPEAFALAEPPDDATIRIEDADTGATVYLDTASIVSITLYPKT